MFAIANAVANVKFKLANMFTVANDTFNKNSNQNSKIANAIALHNFCYNIVVFWQHAAAVILCYYSGMRTTLKEIVRCDCVALITPAVVLCGAIALVLAFNT